MEALLCRKLCYKGISYVDLCKLPHLMFEEIISIMHF